MQGNYYTTNREPSSYARGYALFLNRTNFRQEILLATERCVVPHLRVTPQQPLHVLDLGCGDGMMTAEYLQRHIGQYPTSTYRVQLIEPSDALKVAETCFTTMSSISHVERFAMTAEDFFKIHVQVSDTWDWIIASHVFYHLDPALLLSCAEHLSETGTFFLTLGSPNHPLRRHPILAAASRYVGFTDIAPHLEKLPNRFSVENIDVPTTLNLRGLRKQDGELTKEGCAVYSFIYNTDVQQFSPEQRETLKDVLDELDTRHNGLLHHAHRITLVRRR